MSVGQPFNVYREQLSSLYHGLALWDPKPVENLHKQPAHVSIGDVGYLDNGSFMRIFNVTLPWDDPSNKLLGEPEKYECIEPSYVRDNEMREGEYCTPTVSKVDNVGANRHEDSIGQMYQCSAQHRGALLSLPHKGLRKDVISMKVFEEYIRENVDSWFRWSKKMKLPVERMEDLILVTGCTLVSSWAAAAFDRYMLVSDVTTISLEARKSDGGRTQYFWRNIRGSVEYHNSRFDPNVQDPLPQNQCIFIRGFRAKRTFFRTISMRAAAEPLPDDPDDRREDDIKVTRIPDGSNYRDPLVGILDYIIQKCNEDISAAEDIIAITHDDDLQLIEDVESLTADAIENFLHENQLPLMVENGSAILRKPPDDKSPVSHGEKKQPAPIDQPSSVTFPLPPRPSLPFSLTPPGPVLPAQIRYPLPGTSSRAESQEDSFSGSQLPSQPASIRVVDSNPLGPTLLVDGYISHSFGPESAERYFSHILKSNAISASYHPGAGTDVASFVVDFPNQYSRVLDRCVLRGVGTVVPQVLWTLHTVTDRRQHVQDAELQMPIFFMHTDGGLGLTLEAAVGGRCNTLLDSQCSVPLGPQTTTHIRICWRGYQEFRRQVSIRDNTFQHNTVTLSKFAQHVGRSVDAFLKTAQVDLVNPVPQWRIGGRDIQHHEVLIIGVTQVSSGSWMPILQLTRYIL